MLHKIHIALAAIIMAATAVTAFHGASAQDLIEYALMYGSP
jgi:hypothetical protein